MEDTAFDVNLTVDELRDKYNPDGDNSGHPTYTRADWRYEVSQENTLRGYWDWVAAQLEQAENE